LINAVGFAVGRRILYHSRIRVSVRDKPMQGVQTLMMRQGIPFLRPHQQPVSRCPS
jgi:hypothetical protein